MLIHKHMEKILNQIRTANNAVGDLVFFVVNLAMRWNGHVFFF